MTSLDVSSNGTDNVGVQDLSTASGREEEPDGEDGLEDKVEGEPVENGTESGRLQKVEETESDPVSQPLLVIVGRGRLDSTDREIGGKSPSNQVGNGRSETEQVEEDQGHKGEGETEDTVSLGDLGLGLEVVEEAVFGELLVKDTELSVGNLGRLLDVGVVEEVLLDLLRLSRHLWYDSLDSSLVFTEVEGVVVEGECGYIPFMMLL